MSDIRIGDEVRWTVEGTVISTCLPGLASFARVDCAGTLRIINIDVLELISRPEPKVAVELTYEQLDHLCIKTAMGSPSEIYETFNDARNQAYEETYG